MVRFELWKLDTFNLRNLLYVPFRVKLQMYYVNLSDYLLKLSKFI